MLITHSSFRGLSLLMPNQTSQSALPLIGLDAARPVWLGARASFSAEMLWCFHCSDSLAQIWHRRVAPTFGAPQVSARVLCWRRNSFSKSRSNSLRGDGEWREREEKNLSGKVRKNRSKWKWHINRFFFTFSLNVAGGLPGAIKR